MMPLPKVQAAGGNEKHLCAEHGGEKRNRKFGEYGRFAGEVDGVYNGSRSPTQSVEIGKTPPIYEQFGANPLALTINPNTMYKIAYPDRYLNGKHNLGILALKQLPTQLQDPMAILRSQSQPNSLVVLTQWEDMRGRPVIVPLHLDKSGTVNVENNIASAYGHNGIKAMLGGWRKCPVDKEKRGYSSNPLGTAPIAAGG